MADRIEKLTPEQEKLIPVIRERWRTNGLSTERVAPEEAKQAVCELYKAAGLDEPELILIAQSPMQALLMRGALQTLPTQKDQLGGQLRGQLWDQLWDQLGDQLGGQLWDQLWGQLGGQLGGQLRGQLWDQLGDQIYQSLWMTGGSDGPWIALYEAGRNIGADYTKPIDTHLNAYIRYATTCGVAFCYSKIAFVSDRPTKLVFDDNRLLHCENGPAIEFSDGWAIYAWRGIRVPEEWITSPDKLTPQTALTWENIEQRRAACEILGWETILTKLDAKTIDKDPEPEIGELVEVTIPEIGREKFLRVVCGTGRKFALPVPPEMTTALEANAWTYGVDETLYKQLEYRT